MVLLVVVNPLVSRAVKSLRSTASFGVDPESVGDPLRNWTTDNLDESAGPYLPSTQKPSVWLSARSYACYGAAIHAIGFVRLYYVGSAHSCPEQSRTQSCDLVR